MGKYRAPFSFGNLDDDTLLFQFLEIGSYVVLQG